MSVLLMSSLLADISARQTMAAIRSYLTGILNAVAELALFAPFPTHSGWHFAAHCSWRRRSEPLSALR